MAQGVGVGAWNLASPDFPQGANDFAAIIGDGQAPPTSAAPPSGATPTPPPPPSKHPASAHSHIATGTGASGSPAGRASHWSNLFDPNGPLLYLMIATVLYFGLVSLRVGAKAGHISVGAKQLASWNRAPSSSSCSSSGCSSSSFAKGGPTELKKWLESKFLGKAA